MPTPPKIGGFILAAGEGRRLRPATLLRPKALTPFGGLPLLELVASRLAPLAPDGLAANACHLADTVELFCRDLTARRGWPVALSRETRLLDTGGGLRQGAALLPHAEHLLVHNADIVADADLVGLLDIHLRTGAIATILLVPNQGPRTVELNADGTVTAFRQPRGQAPYTFCGIYVIRRDLLRFLPDAEACSIVDAFEAAGRAGHRVQGIPLAPNAFWSDLGTPADYITAHGAVTDAGIRHVPELREIQAEQARRRADLERTGVRVTGAAGLGAHIQVPPGTHLHNVVLWDDTRIAHPALYADTILTGNPVFPPPVDGRRRPDPRVFTSLDTTEAASTLVPLRKQGSGRLFSRLGANGQSWIWSAYSHTRRENAAAVAVSRFLDRLGVRTPAIVMHLGDVGEIVFRDLGGHDLQAVDEPAVLEPLLADVLRQAARLHVLGTRAVRFEELPLQPGFTKGLYDWERDYFREHILGRLLAAPELWTPAAAAYCELRNRLLAEPDVPIHRDLQSANVMVLDGQAFLIDFQGMRPGCAAYDVASLLYDPYKQHPAERRERLWRHYQNQVRSLGGIPPTDIVFHTAASQRLLQALGAYGKLWLGDGLDWYRPFIRPALGLLAEAATAANAPALRDLAKAILARPQLGTPF